MGQELINAVQIDCDSPESLRLDNSGTDRTNQIVFLLPSWAMSLLAHAILLLLLACVTFPAVGDSLPRILTILPTKESEEEEPTLVQLNLEQDRISTEQILESYVGGFDESVHLDGAAEFVDDVFDATQLVAEIEEVPEFFWSVWKRRALCLRYRPIE